MGGVVVSIVFPHRSEERRLVAKSHRSGLYAFATLCLANQRLLGTHIAVGSEGADVESVGHDRARGFRIDGLGRHDRRDVQGNAALGARINQFLALREIRGRFLGCGKCRKGLL